MQGSENWGAGGQSGRGANFFAGCKLAFPTLKSDIITKLRIELKSIL